MTAKLTAQERLQLIKRVASGEKVSKVCKEAGISRIVFYRWQSRYKEFGDKGLGPLKSGPGAKLEHKIYPRLSPRNRLLMVNEVTEQGQDISNVAKKYGVSRNTLYKWISRYRVQKSRGVEPDLSNTKRVVEHYYRETPDKYVDAVLAMVAKHPEYGIRTIVKNLPKVGTTPVVGHHGVQNILKRRNLLHYAERLDFARSQITPVTETIHTSLAPLTKFFGLSLPAREKFLKYSVLTGFSLFSLVVTLGLTTFLLSGDAGMTGLNKLGIIFSGTALFMGSIFFLYSLKYYLSLAIVLSYSNKKTENVKPSRFVSWILGQNESRSELNKQTTGLEPNLDHVKLTEKPFISVQIPFYNEKNVVRRAIEAAVSFKYPNYEIILCDDSTDETSEIITKYQKSCLFKGESLKITENKAEGWMLAEVEVKPGVTLKHLHRFARQGFKGQALSVALKLVNPKTEFISIFDADFVPYPDSLELFLKYFQAASPDGTLRNLGKNAAVQGYQWHVLNKSENWITRGVRSEYAGSYIIERSGAEIYGGLKQISGSVYMIRRDVLDELGWGKSITEDFELTLRLYDKGYKVLYSPYIQAPAECVSTLKRLIRQRMRWAEGHSFNVKKMFWRLILNKDLTLSEKFEFLYLTPYYLQAFFFLVGTFCWLIAETVLQTRLPFWTETWGWSLIITNMISLPLLNAVGLFVEESDDRDYAGLGSFLALSYILVPFQAYASVRGLLEKEEGPWFRTPKTGRITDIFTRSGLVRFIQGIIPGTSKTSTLEEKYLALSSANNRFSNFDIRRKKGRAWVGKAFMSVLIALSVTISSLTPYIKPYAPKDAHAFAKAGSKGNEVDTIPDDYLAINTDKASYKPGEIVKISMAVINHMGETVCDADLVVNIVDPDGISHKHSISEGSVRINNKYCSNKELLTIKPDYEARYTPELTGEHKMFMEATRFGETYKVTGSFNVSHSNSFDIKRTSASRIYPKNLYPMIFTVRPDADYKGVVTEDVPTGFEIYEPTNLADLEKYVTLRKGFESGITKGMQRRQITPDTQKLIWEVDWKKGQEYIFAYFFDTPDKSPDLYEVGPLSIGQFTEGRSWSLAIDASGSGTNSVSGTTASLGAADQTFTFTYDPSETYTTGGEVRIKVPNSAGWSTPQGSAGTAGYTTASISGTGKIADLLITSDATTEGSWTLTEDDTDACNTSNPAVDTSVFVEGTGSIKCGNSGSALTDDSDSFSFDHSSTVNWSSYDTIGFWIRSSKTLTASNTIEFAYDDTATLATPLQAFSVGTSVSANTWTYFTFTLTASRTAVKAFGLVAFGGGFDSADQYLDEVTIGPGTPTFVANGSDTDIRVRLISLDTAATLTVTYGSGGGTSGADVPYVSGKHVFTTRSRVATSSTYSSPAEIASHPVVTVGTATGHSFQRKTWYDGTRYWRAFYDSGDARMEFEYSTDGSSWTEDTSARISVPTNDFTIHGNSSEAYVAYKNDAVTSEDTLITDSALKAYWKMNEASWNGTTDEVVDSTGNANHGTRAGNATTTSSGYFSNSGTFDGSGDNFNAPDDATLDITGDFTLSAWYARAGGVNSYIITKFSSTGSGGYALLNGQLGEVYCRTDNGTSFVDSFTATGHVNADSTWHHVAVVRSGSSCRVYIDGTDQTSSAGTHTTLGANNLSLYVGESPTGSEPLNGKVDDARIYNRALSAKEIETLSDPGFDIEVRKASSYPGTGFSWSNETVALNGSSSSNYYQYATIAQDTNSKLWVGGVANAGGSTYVMSAARSSAASDITSWDATDSLNSSANSNKYGVIVPRTSGAAQAIYIDGTAITSKNYNGSAWDGSGTSVATGLSGGTSTISATADSSGNVHLLYINSSGNTDYKEYTSSWQTAVTLDSNATNLYPSISLDTSNGDLYAFWIRSDDIFYKKGSSPYTSGSWDTNATSWQTTGTLTWISSVYSYNAPSFAVWTTGSGSPPIDWDIIPIPELTWLFFAGGPLIPLLTKLKRKKHAEKSI